MQIEHVVLHAHRLDAGPRLSDHVHDGSDGAAVQPSGLHQALAFGSGRDDQDQPAVREDARPGKQAGVIRPVNQLVIVAAKPVQHHLASAERRRVVAAGPAVLRVGPVEETSGIRRPHRFHELRVRHDVRGVRSGIHRADPQLYPVAAGPTDPVGEPLAVRAELRTPQRRRSIGGELSRVDQHARAGGQGRQVVRHGDNVLVLAAVVAVEQVAPAAGSRHAGSRHVEDRAELLLKPAPGREARQVLSGEGILGGHPLLGMRGAGILQPAIGIGDLDAVQGFGDQAAFRVRVTHLRLPGSKSADRYLHDTIGRSLVGSGR